MEPIVNQHEGLENIEKTEKKDWIIELKEDLKKFREGEDNGVRKRSIYKLPEHVTNRDSEAYKPKVVSIGPYHNGEEPLQAMEIYKLQALDDVLRLSGIPLDSYVDDLKTIVEELRDAYDKLDDKWKQDTSMFLRMMILDGCFILYILRSNLMKIYEFDDDDDDDDERDFSDDDHSTKLCLDIFSKHGNIHVATLVRRDVLLIENQVPLLLLEKILRVEASDDEHVDLLKVILKFWSQDTPFIKDRNCLHILDVHRKSLVSKLVHTANTQIPIPAPYFYKYLQMLQYIPAIKFSRYFNKRNKEKDHDKETDHNKEKDHDKETDHNKEKDHIRHSATEMKEAGIKFRCISEGNQIMSFEGTTLWLPKLFLDAASKSTFLNIMAFERFNKNAGNEWTTYIFFKNKLIKSVSDVILLKEEEIIYNSMGSDKDVVQLFYQLSKEIALDSNTSLDKWYVDISNKINNYYCSHISTLRKWKYNLMTTYFKSPWTIIAVLGATSILGLTVTQTVYTILSYGNR